MKNEEQNLDKLIAELAGKLDKKVLMLWATDCAERVLEYFEKEYPCDLKPRHAIEVGRTWLNQKIKLGEIRAVSLAAHATARSAINPAARAAARAAGQAVATAHAKGHAIHAAAYAIKAIAAAHPSDFSATTKEQCWQYQYLLDLSKLLLL